MSWVESQSGGGRPPPCALVHENVVGAWVSVRGQGPQSQRAGLGGGSRARAYASGKRGAEYMHMYLGIQREVSRFIQVIGVVVCRQALAAGPVRLYFVVSI